MSLNSILFLLACLMLFSCNGKKGVINSEPAIYSYSNDRVAESYSLQVVEQIASCGSLQLVNAGGRPLKVSAYLNKVLSSCPTYAEVVTDQLFFHDSEQNELKLFSITENKLQTLQAFPDENDDFSYVVRSSNEKHLLFATINQNNIPNPGRQYHFQKLDDVYVHHIKYDLPMNYTCGGRCVASDFEVDNSGEIKFMRNINIEERPGEWVVLPFVE